jgi:hypothetical protein
MNSEKWLEIKKKYAVELVDVTTVRGVWGRERGNKTSTITYHFKIGQTSHFEVEREVFFEPDGKINTYEHYFELEIGGTELEAFLEKDAQFADALIYLVIDTLRTYQHELQIERARLRIGIWNNDNPSIPVKETHAKALQFLEKVKAFRAQLNSAFRGDPAIYPMDAEANEELDLHINQISVILRHLLPDSLKYASTYGDDGSVVEVTGIEDNSGNVALLDYYSGDQSTYFPGNPHITHVYGFSTTLAIRPLGQDEA